MTEKDKRVLKYAIDNLVLREIELCKGSCKSNLENKANRERDRDLIIYGIHSFI